MLYKGNNIKILMKRINEGSSYACHDFTFVTYIAAVEKEDGLYNFFTGEKVNCTKRLENGWPDLENVPIGNSYIVDTKYTYLFTNHFYTRSTVIKRLINTNFYFQDLEDLKAKGKYKRLIK